MKKEKATTVVNVYIPRKPSISSQWFERKIASSVVSACLEKKRRVLLNVNNKTIEFLTMSDSLPNLSTGEIHIWLKFIGKKKHAEKIFQMFEADSAWKKT